MQIRQEKGCYTLYKENEAIGTAVVDGTTILRLEVVPRWRGRGYGSYLLKELLRQNGGLDPKQATRFTPGGLYVDATCGNGHDTQFLCTLAGPAGHVLGLDIQQQAVDNTNARLAAAGYGAVGRAVLHDHARLAELVQPGTADCVLFNFGWLPGAEHDVHSTADGSVPALRAALEALRPGGVLAAVLYSGKVIGDAEKQAALAFFKALPLTQYTVLVCEFANWAQTAPLPCFVIKK